jgi:hypothetical protein
MKHFLFAVMMIIVLTGSVTAQIRPQGLLGQKIETGQSFEIQGTVTSVNDSSFIVRGELVAASSEDMSRFKSNHLVNIGNFITVKGEIKNNIMMAESIDVMGKNPEADTDYMAKIQSETITNPDNKSVLDGIVDAIKNILFK